MAAQPRDVDGHRLRPTEDGHVREERDEREQQRADRIHVHRGIERHPSQQSSCWITEPIRRERVSGLVNCQREEKHDELDEDVREVDAGQETSEYIR